MNSYEILKLLNRMLNDRNIEMKWREVIRTAIRHIEFQDGEILDLREDITDATIPEDD